MMQRLQLIFIYSLLYIYWHSSWYSRSQRVKLHHIHVEEQTEKTQEAGTCWNINLVLKGAPRARGWRPMGVETEGGGDPQLCPNSPENLGLLVKARQYWRTHLAVLNEYFIISFLHDLTSQDFNVSEWSKNHGYFTVTVFRLKTGLGLSELDSAPEWWVVRM